MIECSSAKEEILNTYDIETLEEIVKHGAFSGLAKSHNDLEVQIAFYDKYTVEIRTFLVEEFGADYIDQLIEEAEDKDAFKNDLVLSFIELIANEAT